MGPGEGVLCLFQFFQADKVASPSSSFSIGQSWQVSFFAFGLALASPLAFFKALAVALTKATQHEVVQRLSATLPHLPPPWHVLGQAAKTVHACPHLFSPHQQYPYTPSSPKYWGIL